MGNWEFLRKEEEYPDTYISFLDDSRLVIHRTKKDPPHGIEKEFLTERPVKGFRIDGKEGDYEIYVVYACS